MFVIMRLILIGVVAIAMAYQKIPAPYGLTGPKTEAPPPAIEVRLVEAPAKLAAVAAADGWVIDSVIRYKVPAKAVRTKPVKK